MERVYLDHAATSPLHPSVIRAMTSAMESTFGNPSSIHAFGREARRLVDEARSMAARSIGADFEEIVFTSGGTEADNLAIIGTALANANRGKHIITTAIEHHAVLHACEFLESKGFEVTYLPVDASGVVSSREVYAALRDDTILVTIMTVNNEVGTIQPIAEIGSLLKDHPAYFHTDAVQGFGLLPIDVREWNVDLLSVSSHKINGPKGIGFLYIKNGVRISPLFYGGQQERKRRAGTENVPSLAGFAEAIRIVLEERKGRDQKYRRFADRFCAILEKGGICFERNGDPSRTISHILNLSFPGTNVEQLLVNLDLAGIAASSGSACTAGSPEPSHVLVAMYGSDSERVRNSIRFSFGLGLQEEDVERAAAETVRIVKRLTEGGRGIA